MIPKYFFTIFLLTSGIYSSIPKPILFSENPKAVPVQHFDFVYFPKEVVEAHLPAFEKKRLGLRAKKAIELLKLNVSVPANPAKQLELVDLAKRNQIFAKDPKGLKRMALKKELCILNQSLNSIILTRRNLVSDIQRLKRTIKRDCVNSVRLNDRQDAECRAMKDYLNLQMTQFAEINTRERIDLQRMRDIRKEINLI